MAENKKSFVFYTEWIEIFDSLTNEESGRLIKHIFEYVNDKNPITDDKLINLCFIPIRQSLKRDLKKWENYIEKQKANGKKGGRPKTQKTQAFLEKPKKADNVNVNVNVNDINTIVLNIEKIDSWILELKTQKQFLDGLYMTHKLKQNTLGKIALLFKEHLKMHPKNHDNFIDFRNHFGTWIGFKIKKGELGEYLKHQKGEL
jgi:hypothetical protein